MSSSLIFIIDTSTSIQPYLQHYTSAINGVIESQRTTNPRTLLSLITFNDEIKYLCLNKAIDTLPVSPVTEEAIKPNGLTAFHDNVCAILQHVNSFFTNNHQCPPVVVILTDGDDTSSRLLSERHTMLQVARCKARGWRFIYLGVTDQAITIGRKIGFDVCILYDSTEGSFTRIPDAVHHFISNEQQEHVDVDIRELTESIAGVSL